MVTALNLPEFKKHLEKKKQLVLMILMGHFQLGSFYVSLIKTKKEVNERGYHTAKDLLRMMYVIMGKSDALLLYC